MYFSSISPTIRPSRMIARREVVEGRVTPPAGVMPKDTKRLGKWVTLRISVVTWGM